MQPESGEVAFYGEITRKRRERCCELLLLKHKAPQTRKDEVRVCTPCPLKVNEDVSQAMI